MRYYCIKQHDITDCGAACLATISKQHGLKISISKIRKIAGTDKQGTNAYGMVKAAEKLGFKAKAVKGDREAFLSGIPLPCVAHVVSKGNLLHYVVIHKITKNRVIIADPGEGIVKISLDDFFNEWTGILIFVVPSTNFEKRNENRNIFERFIHLLIPQKRLILHIFISSILLTIFGIFSAFYLQFIIDDILPANIENTLTIVSIGVLLLKLFSIVLLTIRSQLLLYLSQKLDISLLLGYYDHVLKLPMEFFGTRKIGEIVSRFQDASSIRDAISKTTLTILIDTIMAVVGGVILFYKNKMLFIIAIIMVLFYMIFVLTFNRPYNNANKRQMEDNSKLTSYLVESLNGIQTIKAFNGEKLVQTETEFKFVRLLKSIFHLTTISNAQEALKTAVSEIGGVIIIWVGAWSVLQGNMTIGSLISFNALLVYFIDPIRNLINLQPILQTAIVASDRLGEILDLEIEKNKSQNHRLFPKTLNGDINFSNVSFRYGTRELILKDFTMRIKKGSRVAIVGESGAGKTTIAKLLLNFYKCESGSISIAGNSLLDINIEMLREKIAYIPQETFLFSGTMWENLTFFLDKPKMEDVIQATKMAQIYDFINRLPMRFETVLDENGSNLSGGQRQRLAIARAILKKPDILILDEATSNLDAVTEKAIQDTLDKYSSGLTTLIIAHRLSTIRKCDCIFIVDKGKIVESGTHEELMNLENGYYKSLYEAQIGV